MKIVVCIKQVPNTKEIKIDPKTGNIIRTGLPSIMNPDDKNALEEALRIKDKLNDVTVSVLSMGPCQAEAVLREAYAMGADKAVLLTDIAFAGSDTWATSKILSSAIQKIGNYDIIFCGRQAIDGDTAQVGPQIAEFLHLPQITYLKKLTLDKKNIIAERETEDGYYVINSQCPILLTAIKELNEPRYPSVKNIYNAYKKEIIVLGIKDLKIEPKEVGLKGSPTRVKKTFSPKIEFKGEMLQGTSAEKAGKLLKSLKEKQVI